MRSRTTHIDRLAWLLGLLAIVPATGAQSPAPGAPSPAPAPLYILLDASGSMRAPLADGSRKLEAVRLGLQQSAAGELQDLEVALRIFGPRGDEACGGTELLLPFTPAADASPGWVERLTQVRPFGRTPITRSLGAALEDLGERGGHLVLIAGGPDGCGEDPCAWVRERIPAGSPTIRLHVVGFDVPAGVRSVLACMADAAGTPYRSASSAETLTGVLDQIARDARAVALYVEAADETGAQHPVDGTLFAPDGRTIEVRGGEPNHVPSGNYILEAGMRTATGLLYRPVREEIFVSAVDDTVVPIRVTVPPTVRARFTDGGQPLEGSLVRVFRGERELFKFQPDDEVFVDEGRYEFRARPEPQLELSAVESFAAGDHKTVVFDIARMVHVRLKLVAAGSGLWFRQNYELWQGGERKFTVDPIDGARVPPGTYDVHLADRLTPWVSAGLEVDRRPEQSFQLEVPVGHVIVRYETGSGGAALPRLCYLGRDAEGDRYLKQADEPIPLVPGNYRVTGLDEGWEPVVVTVEEGGRHEVALRPAR